MKVWMTIFKAGKIMAVLHYFRKFGTSDFLRANDVPDEKKCIVVKSYRNDRPCIYFCRKHRTWEDVQVFEDYINTSCGEVIKGIPVEFPIKPDGTKKTVENIRNNRKEVIQNLRGKRNIPLSLLFSYVNESIYADELVFELENFTDSKGILKDIVAFTLTTIEKNRTIFLRYYMLDRKFMENKLYFSKSEPIFKHFDIYCSLNGSLRIPSHEEVPANSNDFWIQKPKRVDDIAFDVEFPEEAYNQIHSILNLYAGRQITLNTPMNGENLLEALHNFPYEPNIQAVIDFHETLPMNSKFYENHISSNHDPNVYNNFCQFLKIKSFTSLRKEFVHNPVCLLLYSFYSNAGFTDKNILMRIVRDEKAKEILRLPKETLSFYINFLLTVKTEAAAWNHLKKIKNIGDFYIIDALSMFKEYFDNIPEEIKKSVMNEGFTPNTHDLLSKVSWMIHNKNVVFEYNEYEKSLEDNIDGYEFKLPVDSDTLFELGSHLHNCVSTYKEYVENKECVIVFARKEDKYRLCIEIRKDSVWQQRADYNAKPAGMDQIVLKKWIEKHKLITRGY